MRGWLRTGQDDTGAKRREAIARRVARVMNGYDIPGIAPLTLMHKLIIVVLALFLALTLFGLLGAIIPPPHP